jgi:hypothetical protein
MTRNGEYCVEVKAAPTCLVAQSNCSPQGRQAVVSARGGISRVGSQDTDILFCRILHGWFIAPLSDV